MANAYGTTWWGKRWLEALAHIDESDRLSRGKTYANNGSVLDITTNGSTIQAQVQGSAMRPYKQSIQLLAFSASEKRQIVEAILDNPLFLSELLQRRLPQELEAFLSARRIYIFPHSWEEITSSCSCPDYADPCKHRAAVYFKLANEIDKNPFLLFEWRGLDLIAELQQQRQSPEQSSALLFIPPWNSFLSKTEMPAADYAYSQEIAQQLDFSTLEVTSHRIFRLLTPRPLFCPKFDFKDIFQDNYQRLAKAAKKALERSDKDRAVLLPDYDRLEVRLDRNLGYKEIIYYQGELIERVANSDVWMQVEAALGALSLANLLDYCPAIQALHWAHQAALHLWLHGAVVPQLLDGENNRYFMRWIPALLLPEVKTLVEQLAQILPPNVLAVIHDHHGTFYATDPTEQAIAVLSLFLNHRVETDAVNKHKTDAEETFWDGYVLNASEYSKREMPQEIQKWLQPFFLQQKLVAPLLVVEEDGKQEGFWLSCWVEDRRSALAPLIELQRVLTDPQQYADIQFDILRDYALLAKYLPDLANVLQSKGDRKLHFSSQRFVPIFLEVLPMLRLLGIKIMLPKELEQLIRPRPMVSLSAKGNLQTFMNMESLLNFNWQVALGDEHLSPDEFKQLVGKMRGLVKIKGKYVFLDDRNFQDLLKKIEKPPLLSGSEALQAALGGQYEGFPVEMGLDIKTKLEELLSTPPISLPQGVRATLRPYQQRGFEWLYKNARLGFGSLLADDMGLGKTLQAIAFIQKLKEEGAFKEQQAIAVLPTTLIANWARELDKFAPGIRYAVYHGTKRKLDPNAELILTSYGVVRSDEKILVKRTWKLLLIDEAQNIKNIVAAQTRAVKKLHADYRIALSGTPVENRLSEYWSVFDFVNKGYLGGLTYFTREFSRPIELDRDRSTLERFRRITAPFILRRLKTDKRIISDLPDKVEQNSFCQLTPEQTGLYQTVVDNALKTITNESDSFSRQGLVLQMILALKQICNHPAQYLKKKEIDPKLSGKTQLLLELLESILDAGEKVLLFTQYREMGDLLQMLIRAHFHFDPLWLHGGTSAKRRDEIVQQFQHKPYPKVLILSLKAGGTGLNLTEANHVIHFDLWWNPAVEAQATDRAFRIGQKKNVLVYRFLTQNTFEEKIDEMIRSKRDLANLAVEAGENWIGNLSNEELRTLFELR